MSKTDKALPRIASRDEWVAARLGLLKEEKELTRHGDEVAQQRQELPWVLIDKEYRFETDEGSASITRRDARPARRSPTGSMALPRIWPITT